MFVTEQEVAYYQTSFSSQLPHSMVHFISHPVRSICHPKQLPFKHSLAGILFLLLRDPLRTARNFEWGRVRSSGSSGSPGFLLYSCERSRRCYLNLLDHSKQF